jgi:signal peptidase I
MLEDSQEQDLTDREEEISDGARSSIVKRMLGNTLGSVFLFLLEVFQIAIVAVILIVVIRFFIIKPFVVQGGSMEPNFFNDEYLIIDEVTYRFRDIKRGEIVVFNPPIQENQYYIKRIIALPGETFELVDGRITIYNESNPNGFLLKEPYIDEFTQGQDRVTLGENEYYLMGDNRDASLDSRNFGPVKRGSIVGRVWLRGLPIDRIGAIKRPVYTY